VFASSSRARDRQIILIAEDDPNDVLLLQTAVENAGLGQSAFIVRDGQEVIDYLSGAPPFQERSVYPLPALLLLDARMPRVSGLEVLEWLHQRTEAGRIHVVLLTSALDPKEFQRARALGARSCLTKPLDPAQWVPIIGSLQHFCALERLECESKLTPPGSAP
jgi:two-component system response regulator